MVARLISVKERDAVFGRRLGERMRQAREAAGMTQAMAAKRLGLVSKTYWNIEQGNTRIALRDLVEFAQIVDRPVEWFISSAADWQPVRLQRPRSLVEWEQLYADEPHIGRALWEVERAIRSAVLGANPDVDPPYLQVAGKGRIQDVGVQFTHEEMAELPAFLRRRIPSLNVIGERHRPLDDEGIEKSHDEPPSASGGASRGRSASKGKGS